ncbi:MAG: DsbA family oxidoreductase [Alphaproteobacteria bacterium]|nr:DsbA family oxidoreductase [Alphaproteobacteria bacterium]
MRIDIVSDVVCPWCFIGKRRLERALAMRPQPAVEIGWRPFALNPDVPPEGIDRRAYVAAKFGGADKAAQLYAQVAEVGVGENIFFAFDRIERTPNTLQAHRLIGHAGARGVQDAVVEGLFAAYFLDGADIGRTDTLVAVAEDAGMDGAETRQWLEGGAEADKVAQEIGAARQMGIGGVPCFIFERKYALTGAQPPEAFIQVFDRLAEEARADA